MESQKISKEVIQEYLEKLAKVRPPEDMPTEQEVEELLLRMKKRWGQA